MSDSDVRAALQRATDHLTGPPGLLDNVRRRGRRTVLRRRTFLAAGLGLVAAGSVGGLVRFGQGEPGLDAASPLFDQPTRGDLAADRAYLRQVIGAWRRGMSGLEGALGGEPHVVWAGRTPAGPAAYVIQRTAHPVAQGPDGAREVALAAFLEPTAGGPQVMTIETVTDTGWAGNSKGALLGHDRDVLLVLDDGRPVEFSPQLRYAADGKVERTFRPVVFQDGAAVLAVPPQRTKLTVALAYAPVGLSTRVHITNEVLIRRPREQPQRSIRYTLPGAERIWGPDPAGVVSRYVNETGALDAYLDAAGIHSVPESPSLTVYGATRDGRRLLLVTVAYDDDPVRAVVLVADGDTPFTVVASAFADWGAALPVRLRLPDGQGTLVATDGATLAYRVPGGVWQQAGTGAAMLPAVAAEVRVTAADGSVTAVPLS